MPALWIAHVTVTDADAYGRYAELARPRLMRRVVRAAQHILRLAELLLDLRVPLCFVAARLDLAVLQLPRLFGSAHRGELVDCSEIRTTALMTVEGENDDISAPGQCRAALELLTSLPEEKKAWHVEPGAGHYGIFAGKSWRRKAAFLSGCLHLLVDIR